MDKWYLLWRPTALLRPLFSFSLSLSFLSAHDLPSVIERRGQSEWGWHEAKREDEREKKKAACKRWENEQPLMPVYTWSDPRNLFSEEFTRCTRVHKHILHVYTHQCTWDTRETGFVWLSEPSVGCGSSFNALPSGPEWFRPIFLFSGVAFAFRVIPRISVAFKLMFLRRNLNSRTVSTWLVEKRSKKKWIVRIVNVVEWFEYMEIFLIIFFRTFIIIYGNYVMFVS